ncbi:MAG: hypothetical protein C5S45_07925, partial [Candidatus Methanocomedens sp.]
NTSTKKINIIKYISDIGKNNKHIHLPAESE